MSQFLASLTASNIAYAVGVSVLALYALWGLFLAVMNLKQAKDFGDLSPIAYKLGYPMLFIGYLLDVLVQLTIANLIFWDLPRELTVSARVKRLCLKDGWRGRRARWWREVLLAPFDRSGGHS